MCGIAGKLNFDAAAPIDRERLGAMTAVVAHRGPDADGFYVAPGLGLGHRRLSIIDLSTGDQPLANEDGTVWVVFNGEIYNFMEIRSELERAGHRFRTGTDTEVIVHAYEQWGEEAVHRFRGMFAFALWDEPRRRLLLVRDRLGIKPLYYAVTPTGITFGSEIKSLLEDPDVPRDWSAEALDAYLALLYVPGPQTIYRHIRKLPAGHLLVAEDGRVSVRRYWDLTFTGDGDPAREDEYLERLDALVTEAVKIRLLSDVPLGAFLSGGIDSSTVVAAMVRSASARVVTSTVGFDDEAFSELEHARSCRPTSGLRFARDDRSSRRRGAAAEAGLALRRAVRRLVSGSDLLRLSGGARTGHRRALRRRRRRALGRLRTASRGALGGESAPLAGTIRRISCRTHRRLAATGHQGCAIAPPSGVDAGRRVRAQARLRPVREPGALGALSSGLHEIDCRLGSLWTTSVASTTRARRGTRSTGRCTSTSRPIWSTTSSPRSTG